MNHSFLCRLMTFVVFGLTAGTAGCCKDKSDDAQPIPFPEPKPDETKVLTPSQETAQPASTPTPTTASTNNYQSNGFPEVMPSQRTPVPTVSEWSRAPVITTKKFPDGCHMKFVREWLKINCSKDTDTATPLRISSITGFGSEGADYFKFKNREKSSISLCGPRMGKTVRPSTSWIAEVTVWVTIGLIVHLFQARYLSNRWAIGTHVCWRV